MEPTDTITHNNAAALPHDLKMKRSDNKNLTELLKCVSIYKKNKMHDKFWVIIYNWFKLNLQVN